MQPCKSEEHCKYYVQTITINIHLLSPNNITDCLEMHFIRMQLKPKQTNPYIFYKTHLAMRSLQLPLAKAHCGSPPEQNTDTVFTHPHAHDPDSERRSGRTSSPVSFGRFHFVHRTAPAPPSLSLASSAVHPPLALFGKHKRTAPRHTGRRHSWRVVPNRIRCLSVSVSCS